ncbi:MAG: LysR family transcriptional regulator [Stappiaceae bacterium]
MQIEHLETFLNLLETSSFNATADNLGLTQSTVSSRVKVLEESIGKKLFIRSRAGTRPTAAGLRLADHARSVLHEWNAARRSVQRVDNFNQSMRIGLQSDLAASHIGNWVSEFRQALPDTALYVELDYSTQMCADLLAGQMDVAVLFSPRYMPDLYYENVGEVRYRMVSTCAPTLTDIPSASYIFGNYSSVIERAHQQQLPGFNNAPITSGQNAAVQNLLTTLGGSAFVLEETADDLVRTNHCYLVDDVEAIRQPVYLGVHLRRRHQGAHKKLLKIVKRHFSPLA